MNKATDSKKLYKTIIIIGIALLFNVLVYYMSRDKKYVEEAILGSIVLFSFYQFMHLALKKWRYVGYVLVVIGCLIIALNQTLGLITRFIYGSEFTYGHALSILNSNWNEIMSMLSTMTLGVFVFIINILFQFQVVRVSGIIIKKESYNWAVAFLWLIIPTIALSMRSASADKPFSIFLRNTFAYNFRPVMQAYTQYEEEQVIMGTPVDYSNLVVSDSSAHIVVLVIGESARRQNMSLYGYERETTPHQDAEKSNMLLYNNMVSSAGITLFSVPMLLTKVAPEDYTQSKHLLGDNIIQLANTLGYETYWLSTQEEGNVYVSTVTNMSKFASHTHFYKGYDTVLLDPLKKVLASKTKKKFIILHINGSHSNACGKYPATESYFTDGKPFIDCYDNSIRYTDRLMQSIFELLRESNAAVVYLSDHAEKLSDERFVHSDSKEGAEIPYYIWYANKFPSRLKNVRTVDELSSLEINYYEIAKLFGVQNLVFNDKKKIKFLKSDLSVVDYEALIP